MNLKQHTNERSMNMIPPEHKNKNISSQNEEDAENSLRSAILEIGQKLKKRRKECGFSLNDLAKKTRISTAVIESIEKGWIEKLPEPAYLSSMLPSLEKQLKLANGELNRTLIERQRIYQVNANKNSARFTPGSIDVLTTWQGSIVYTLVIIGSLITLNHQQKHLASINSQTLEPIKANTLPITKSNIDISKDSIFKEVRPIENALRRTKKDILHSKADQVRLQPSMGILQIILIKPKGIIINSEGGDRTNLQITKGSLTLQLMPPVSLEIKPKLEPNDQILWNGKSLPKGAELQGIYTLF